MVKKYSRLPHAPRAFSTGWEKFFYFAVGELCSPIHSMEQPRVFRIANAEHSNMQGIYFVLFTRMKNTVIAVIMLLCFKKQQVHT